MKRWAAVVLGAALVAACGAPRGESFKAGALTVDAVTVAPPVAGRDISAAYFTIHNAGAADQLISAASPVAKTVEIHTHEQGADGVMRMRRQDAGVAIPQGDTTFRPGGLHLMMFGVEKLDETAAVPIVLQFRDAGALEIKAQVRAPMAGMDHDH